MPALLVFGCGGLGGGLWAAASAGGRGRAVLSSQVEYACSLPQLVQGKKEEVSRGVTCEDLKEPLGVVAAVVPFNFPLMVPMWTVPIALTTGNCVILKPSEKVRREGKKRGAG